MIPFFRFLQFGLILFALSLCTHAASDNSVVEINLKLRGLDYDPQTQKLYGTSADTNTLLQIDPATGAVTGAFPVAARPGPLALSGGHGLWVGINGAGAVQRFSLDSFTAEDPIIIAPDSQVKDIAPSPVDPYTLAVTLTLDDGSDRSHIIRNGQILPQTSTVRFVALLGNSVYGSEPNLMFKFEIGPNGFQSAISIYGIPLGDSEAYGEYIYHTSGRIRRASDLQVQFPQLAGGNDVAINKTTDELFYLSGGADWTLHRYKRLTKEHTGIASFGAGEPAGRSYDLTAWSTNRAAFHSENKLYLVNTDTLFLPAELEVQQAIAPANPAFGSEFTITLTVTNKGPRPALGVGLTNYIPVNSQNEREIALVSVNGASPEQWSQATAIAANLGDIPPGEWRQFSITMFGLRPGSITNVVAFGANNDFTPENNQGALVFEVAQPTNGLVRFVRGIADAAYDPQQGGVIAYDGEWLWPLDPDSTRLGEPIGRFLGATKLAASPMGGALYLGTHYLSSIRRGIARIPGATNHIVPDIHERSIQAVDIEVSPQSSDLVAGSFINPARLALFRNGAQVGEHRNETGLIAFSSDGSKLYLADSATCALSIYSVSDLGLQLQKSIPSVSCTDFVVSGGLLFFDSGLVYDPVLEQPSAQVPAFIPPAFFVPSIGGFDMLGRTNGAWAVRRFRLGTGSRYEEFALRTIGAIANPVLDAFAAGPNHLAFRTSSELYVTELPADPNAITARISRAGTAGPVAISFPTTQGLQYRIESTPTLSPSQWTTVRNNIQGTGAIITQEFNASATTEFFRVAR